MKLNGVKANFTSKVYCVIPRQDNDLVFMAKAILDYSDYEKLNPQPLPPFVTKRGGGTYQNVEDPAYKTALQDWAAMKMHWMIIKSLELPSGASWETVDFADKSTWLNYLSELKDAGFSDYEVNRILNSVLEANGINQTKIDEAQKRFLASLETM